MVESAVTKLGNQAAGEADRAEGLAARRGDAGQGVFGREEAPVEARVVGDEHCGIQRSSETGHDERRSEEHTSELQSQSNLVCRLLLEKKKMNRMANLHDALSLVYKAV